MNDDVPEWVDTVAGIIAAVIVGAVVIAAVVILIAVAVGIAHTITR